MSSSTSNSDSHAARSFLGVLFLLVLATEASLAALVPANEGRHEVDDCAYLVETYPAPIRVTFLSDSVSYGVLDSVDLAPDILDLSSNQEIGLAGNFFLVQRLFARLDAEGAAPPPSVVLAMNPLSFDTNLEPSHYLDPYFASVFLRESEIADVEHTLGRPELTALQRRDARAHALGLPSHQRCGLVQLPLRNALRAIKRRLDREEGGAFGTPGGASRWAAIAAAKIQERSQLSFHVSQVTDAYLPKLLELCAERGTRVRIVPSPVTPSVRRTWEESGYWLAYRDWLGGLEQRYPNLSSLAECPYSPAADPLFYDGVHLTQTGKNDWARSLQRILMEERSRRGPRR